MFDNIIPYPEADQMFNITFRLDVGLAPIAKDLAVTSYSEYIEASSYVFRYYLPPAYPFI